MELECPGQPEKPAPNWIRQLLIRLACYSLDLATTSQELGISRSLEPPATCKTPPGSWELLTYLGFLRSPPHLLRDAPCVSPTGPPPSPPLASYRISQRSNNEKLQLIVLY